MLQLVVRPLCCLLVVVSGILATVPQYTEYKYCKYEYTYRVVPETI